MWISPGHQGATYDSTAWDNTRLKDEFEKSRISEEAWFVQLDGLAIIGSQGYLQLGIGSFRVLVDSQILCTVE